MYYYNCASDLHSGALVIWDAGKGKTASNARKLGLGEGFSLAVSLPPVFRLLAGQSLESLLKAIAKILGRPDNHSHNLCNLCDHSGIRINEDQKAILDVLTECIRWNSRYPTPKNEREWEAAQKIFGKLRNQDATSLFTRNIPEREISLRNYKKIWGFLSEFYWEAKKVIIEP